MYQNCCKKCGSISLHTEEKGNNVGLYCDDCGAWIKWLSKDELRAFNHAKEMETKIENNIVVNDTTDFRNAVIAITKYMAFFGKEVCTFREPINVDGYKGVKLQVIPTVCYQDVTEY